MKFEVFQAWVCDCPLGIVKYASGSVLVGVMVLTLSGCGRLKSFRAASVLQEFRAQAQSIKSCRGRAWISVKTSSDSVSFPAVVVMDRSQQGQTRVRLEATDPLGVTHHVIVMGPRGQEFQMRWLDFDSKLVMAGRDHWYGIPLSWFGDLLLGVTPLAVENAESVKIIGSDAQGFSMRGAKGLELSHEISTVGETGRWGLSRISAIAGGMHFFVSYKRFLDTADYYLPAEIELHSEKLSTHKIELEMKITWRDRVWNEPLDLSFFELPDKL